MSFCLNICKFFDDHKNITVHNLKDFLDFDITMEANQWHETLVITYKDCIYMQLWTFHYQRAFTVNQVESVCNSETGRNTIFSYVPTAVQSQDTKDIWCDKDNYVLFTFPKSVITESIKGSSSDHVTRSKMC